MDIKKGDKFECLGTGMVWNPGEIVTAEADSLDGDRARVTHTKSQISYDPVLSDTKKWRKVPSTAGTHIVAIGDVFERIGNFIAKVFQKGDLVTVTGLPVGTGSLHEVVDHNGVKRFCAVRNTAIWKLVAQQGIPANPCLALAPAPTWQFKVGDRLERLTAASIYRVGEIIEVVALPSTASGLYGVEHFTQAGRRHRLVCLDNRQSIWKLVAAVTPGTVTVPAGTVVTCIGGGGGGSGKPVNECFKSGDKFVWVGPPTSLLNTSRKLVQGDEVSLPCKSDTGHYNKLWHYPTETMIECAGGWNVSDTEFWVRGRSEEFQANHVCQFVEMGFRISKRVCPVCNEEEGGLQSA